MKNEHEAYKKVFERLLEADKSIWAAVLEIKKLDDEKLESLVQPLMQLRGEIHVEFMRPIYTKYPELAKSAGFDDEE